ncbi:MAG: hypothetical protein KDB16_17010, partial [Acidimicrobiales bacterium]|nr:hypothetical protein [Acidimicrobiales bacterium]
MTTNGSNSTRAVLRAVTLTCGLFLVGCGSADESVEAQPLVLPDGWFEMSGYGTVLHVEGDEITPHFVTPSTCTVGESFDNTLVVDHTETEDGVVVVDLVGPTTDYRLLPLVGPPRCEANVADTLTALDEAFTRHYPFFDQRGIDWPERFEAIQAAVSAGHDLEPTLASFLQTLGDGHTTLDGQDIEPDLGRFGLAAASDSQDLVALIDGEVASTLGRLTEPQIDETGTVVWGGLDAHTGYLLMSSFVDLGQGGEDAWADVTSLRSALDLAVADLDSRFDSLVIDMRFNPGGHEDLAVLAAGYFAQRPGPAY